MSGRKARRLILPCVASSIRRASFGLACREPVEIFESVVTSQPIRAANSVRLMPSVFKYSLNMPPNIEWQLANCQLPTLGKLSRDFLLRRAQ
jgi:hypothetical protein